jgi:hypothetical protein
VFDALVVELTVSGFLWSGAPMSARPWLAFAS